MIIEKYRNKLFFLFLVAFFAIWTLRATVFYSIDLEIESPISRKLYSESVKLLLWTIPVFLFVIFVEKSNPLTELKLNRKPAKKNLLCAAIVSAVFFAIIIAFEYIVNERFLDLNLTLIEILKLLGSVSVSPVFEEILFRGLILEKLSKMTSFGKANMITSVLFVAVHYPNWLWVNGFRQWILVVSVSIFILSLLLGWLVKKTDSLYPSIIVHIINNFISLLLKA
jgi:membrane protease YdiL (CAAX protease family)